MHRCLLLPPAPQSLVELNHGLQFVTPGSSQVQFDGEQVAVGIQGIEESIDSSSIPHVGQARPVLQRGDQQFLLCSDFRHSAMLNERIRDFAERGFDGSFILDQRNLPPGLRQFDIRPDAAALEDRLDDLGDKLPCSGRAGGS